MNTVIAFGHNRLDVLKRQIKAAHERALHHSGADWAEASLQLAVALREARELMPTNISFSDWLKQEGLDFYNRTDRGALIGFAGNPVLARSILSTVASTSYQLIWHENRHHFQAADADAMTTATKRFRPRSPNRKYLNATMKLGEEAVARIKGTSLDRAEEIKELIMLNRGAALGELTAVVRHLIDDAAAGKDVSAVATTKKSFQQPTTGRLVVAWRRRMIAAWQLAKFAEQVELIDYLVTSLPRQQRDQLVEHLIDNLYPKGGTKNGS